MFKQPITMKKYNLNYTVSQKRTNFQTVKLKTVRIDFDDIRQKYSKD